MSKFILMSIVIAMFYIPIRASKEKDVRKGLKKAITQMFVFEALYVVALKYLWGRV
jgi:hypothetical protein